MKEKGCTRLEGLGGHVGSRFCSRHDEGCTILVFMLVNLALVLSRTLAVDGLEVGLLMGLRDCLVGWTIVVNRPSVGGGELTYLLWRINYSAVREA